MDRLSLISTRTRTAHEPGAVASPGRRRGRAATAIVGLLAALMLLGAACDMNAESIDVAVRVNETRSQAGLRKLAIDETLSAKAQAWADRMAAAGNISHSTLAEGAGNNWTVLGENVGVAGSIAQMHSLFMNSPGHRANIVSGRFNRIGTGVTQVGNEYYVVQVFAG